MFYHENLAYDEFLKDSDPTGESIYNLSYPHFKIWIPRQKLVVLGRSQKMELECNLENVHQNPIPILRRKSGGGAVLLSPQTICLTFRFSRIENLGILNYIQKGSKLIQDFLKTELQINSHQEGSGDICINNHKILGCSLRMNKNWAFYLSSLIINDIRPDVDYFLSTPTRQPRYRKNRHHKEFLSFLNAHLKRSFSISNLLHRLDFYFQKNLQK